MPKTKPSAIQPEEIIFFEQAIRRLNAVFTNQPAYRSAEFENFARLVNSFYASPKSFITQTTVTSRLLLGFLALEPTVGKPARSYIIQVVYRLQSDFLDHLHLLDVVLPLDTFDIMRKLMDTYRINVKNRNFYYLQLLKTLGEVIEEDPTRDQPVYISQKKLGVLRWLQPELSHSDHKPDPTQEAHFKKSNKRFECKMKGKDNDQDSVTFFVKVYHTFTKAQQLKTTIEENSPDAFYDNLFAAAQTLIDNHESDCVEKCQYMMAVGAVLNAQDLIDSATVSLNDPLYQSAFADLSTITVTSSPLDTRLAAWGLAASHACMDLNIGIQRYRKNDSWVNFFERMIANYQEDQPYLNGLKKHCPPLGLLMINTYEAVFFKFNVQMSMLCRPSNLARRLGLPTTLTHLDLPAATHEDYIDTLNEWLTNHDNDESDVAFPTEEISDFATHPVIAQLAHRYVPEQFPRMNPMINLFKWEFCCEPYLQLLQADPNFKQNSDLMIAQFKQFRQFLHNIQDSRILFSRLLNNYQAHSGDGISILRISILNEAKDSKLILETDEAFDTSLFTNSPLPHYRNIARNLQNNPLFLKVLDDVERSSWHLVSFMHLLGIKNSRVLLFEKSKIFHALSMLDANPLINAPFNMLFLFFINPLRMKLPALIKKLINKVDLSKHKLYQRMSESEHLLSTTQSTLIAKQQLDESARTSGAALAPPAPDEQSTQHILAKLKASDESDEVFSRLQQPLSPDVMKVLFPRSGSPPPSPFTDPHHVA